MSEKTGRMLRSGAARTALAAGLALCLAAGGARALDVEHVRWGFDGRAVPEQLNLLTVTVSAADEPFDGAVELYKSLPPRGRVGAVLRRRCYATPGVRLALQFHPYVADVGEQWVLRWKGGTYRVPPPTLGVPARVFLGDPANPARAPEGIRMFPADQFPPSVCATDGLAVAVLDHAPRWEPARRQAFMDWLRRGGTLYLLRDRAGRRPQFAGEMAPLNNPSAGFRVLAGRVVVRPESGAEAGPLLKRPTGTMRDPTRGTQDQDWDGTAERRIFRLLRPSVHVRHAWTAIFLVLVLYAIVICPGHFLFARRIRDLRRALAFYFGVLLVAASALSWIGRRGHGELSRASTVAYARPLGGGLYDVTQWADLFAVRSDEYPVRHVDRSHLYSTCQELESVDGVVLEEGGGMFAVKMPLFSHQSLLHRGRLQGPDLGLRVTGWKEGSNGSLAELIIETGPEMPRPLIGAFVVHAGMSYRLLPGPGQLRAGRIAQPVSGEFSSDFHPFESAGPSGGPSSMEVGRAHLRRNCRRIMEAQMARVLGARGIGRYRLPARRVPADTAQVFLMAESPEGFRIQGDVFSEQVGYVLYHIDIHKPEVSDG